MSKMMFKNILAFRLSPDLKLTANALSEQLAKHRFHTCGSQEEQSRGFVAPHGDEHAPLVHSVGGQYLIALQEQKRILPSSVVKEATAERAAAIAEQQGCAVGRKQLKEIKELVRMELLPKAFLKTSQIRAWLNPKDGWLAIEAGSSAKGDLLIEQLGKAMGEFPASRLNTEISPVTAMTDWLTSGAAPEGFTVDRDCELRSPVEDKSAVRYVRHSLEGDDVRQHLAEGKLPTRLALTYADRVGFVLTDKQEIKSVKLLDIATSEVESDADNQDDLFDAEFSLMAGEYTSLLVALTEALGGEAGAS